MQSNYFKLLKTFLRLNKNNLMSSEMNANNCRRVLLNKL